MYTRTHAHALLQTAGNHHAGPLLFAPADIANPLAPYHDMYIVNGDGGGQQDPYNRAQNMTSPLGKILKIRLSTAANATGYDVPDDNPFAALSGKPAVSSVHLHVKRDCSSAPAYVPTQCHYAKFANTSFRDVMCCYRLKTACMLTQLGYMYY